MGSSMSQFYEEMSIERKKLGDQCKTKEDKNKLNSMYKIFHKDFSD